MDNQKKSTEAWQKYWHSALNRGILYPSNLYTFQLALFKFLEKIIADSKSVRILSAGAGQDLFSFHLQKRFKNSLDITILDISSEVLNWNKKLFRESKLNAKFIKADLFKLSLRKNSFDLVFNTGVLEHFNKNEQVKITKGIIEILKPGGIFITANPSSSGKIYKLGMDIAKRNNTWPYGLEAPITSLKFLSRKIDQIDEIREYHKDFFTQLSFLRYINKYCYYAIMPIKLLSKFKITHALFDPLFSRFFGTYLIISIIKKVSKKTSNNN